MGKKTPEPKQPINISTVDPTKLKEYIDTINKWKGEADQWKSVADYWKSQQHDVATVYLEPISDMAIPIPNDTLDESLPKMITVTKVHYDSLTRIAHFRGKSTRYPYISMMGMYYPKSRKVEWDLELDKPIYTEKDRFGLWLNLSATSPVGSITYNIKDNWHIGLGISPRYVNDSFTGRMYIIGGISF